MKAKLKTIYLAGGCFWGLEKYLSLIEGVVETTVGYANGNLENPSYEQVCQGDTGHAEAVRVVFDTARLGLTFLLEAFYQAIDPTLKNQQGGDIGVQYRSGVYYIDDEDRDIVLGSVALLQESFSVPLEIEVKICENYATAEEYHQKYLWKNEDGYCHIAPDLFEKAAKMRDTITIERDLEKQALKERLTDMQFEVTQNGATEPPFKNAFYHTFNPGLYVDIINGKALFISKDKFDAGCGWPSFAKPIAQNQLEEVPDYSHGRNRVEVRSAESDAHLGHVFQDGPQEMGGLRYCINSAALRFVPKDKMEEEGYREYLYLLD